MPRYQEQILDEYLLGKYRLHHSEIFIHSNNKTCRLYYKSQDKSYANIAIGHARVLFVLKAFGSVFNQIHLNIISTEYTNVRELANHINEYCSKASQQVTLFRGYGDEYASHGISFPYAQNVSILPSPHQMTYTNSIDLNALFPQMEKLTVEDIDQSYFGHFPNLLDFEFSSIFDDLYNWDTLLALNPQLERVNPVIFRNLTYLNRINHLLPNLEALHLKLPHPQDIDESTIENVRFENVREFTLNLVFVCGDIDENIQNLLTSIEFDRLESFKLISFVELAKDFQIDLITRNDELNNVEIEYLELNSDDMKRLTRSLPKLKTMTLMCSKEDTIREVNAFLMSEVRMDEIRIASNDICLRKFRMMVNLTGNWRMSEEDAVNGFGLIVFENVLNRF